MSIDDAMRYARSPCALFIGALQEVADLIEGEEVVSTKAIWGAMEKHLGGKNWYPKYTDKTRGSASTPNLEENNNGV